MSLFTRCLLLASFAGIGIGGASWFALHTEADKPTANSGSTKSIAVNETPLQPLQAPVKSPAQFAAPKFRPPVVTPNFQPVNAKADAAMKAHIDTLPSPTATIAAAQARREQEHQREEQKQREKEAQLKEQVEREHRTERQIERLHEQIARLQEETRRGQFTRLEDKFERFEETTREQNRRIDERLERLLQPPRYSAVPASEWQPLPLPQNLPAAPLPTQPVALQPANSDFESHPAEEGLPAINEELPAEEEPRVESIVEASQGDTISAGEGDNQLSINIKNGDLREVLDSLSEQFELNILVSESVTGSFSASLRNVDIHTALNAILTSRGYVARQEGPFMYVGTAEDFASMAQRGEDIVTRIYRPNYVSANELMTLVTPILTPNIGSATPSSESQVGIPTNGTEAGGDDFAGNEVLLVRDYPSVLAEIDTVVASVDIRPRQVAIEAMVLSVALDDENSMGVNFEMLRDVNNVRLVSGSPLSSLAQVDVSSGGLNVGFLDSNVGAFVNALERVGDTNVVARPRLMCLNKQRAEILIGDQIGFVNTTQTETATTQTVEFLDVGTQLRIRPFISDDGMIRMEVHPELSTGEVKLVGSFALPEKSTTQVTTNIMCGDGCTLVIGGLIREDVTDITSQIPLVGSIPGIGAAFRNRRETITRNEIIVLITPRVVYDPAYSDGDSCELENFESRQAQVDMNSSSFLHRRRYSNRYAHLAESAFSAGNFEATERFINIALKFNPDNQSVIELRNRLISQGTSIRAGDVIIEEPQDLPYPTDLMNDAFEGRGEVIIESSAPQPPAIPHEAIPSDAIPSDAIPSDAIPHPTPSETTDGKAPKADSQTETIVVPTAPVPRMLPLDAPSSLNVAPSLVAPLGR